ncbi:MAG: metalloregulator ArsR/SmtB family transcription factor [Candidatus Latescibacteria bacterium]|jgi:DNA-binding transcriptional ArsR family regulator|nr:metalloregulator ArsR/SmtB family transcription factor [Candidatus Latescibacterota bacterium]MDP7449617.1 metalloregulator ArsR/SmtB family transcription factor [Candidatus Latescibacterota bacterium]HJP29797.1 metalloregulator ArsR/SmtB family transcription factor [Candidatus Latescibacterota bacterium]|tara:strand:- start:222 stop:1409 length:1188 start_codon:yes stop_codon:yes gene_type:complete
MAVIDSGETSDLRTRFQFSHGLRLEVFYALQALTDSSDIHQSWRQAASEALPEEFYRAFAALGNTPILWPLLADAPGTIDASVSFQQLMDSLQTLDLDTFREGILVGALHDRDVVVDLVEGHLDLAAAIDRAPEHKKHLWYTCVGLYPYDEHAAVPLALQRALHDPEGFRTDALLCLNLFWEHVFAATWEGLEPELLRSVREKRRLFEALSVSEFLEQAIMRLEIDEERQVLRSLRGGCEIPLDRLHAAHIMPSAFNTRRMWTSYTDAGCKICETVFVPYFDASIAVEPLTSRQVAPPAPQAAPVNLEPALIFKALGDGTRYAMVQLIGRQARTSADLARELGVSKATISHHLSLLREAGLVSESYESGSVRLSLKTEVIHQLSTLASTAFAPTA